MDYRAMVRQIASESGLDPNIAEAVLVQESGGNPKAVSSAGARGLMQLMPDTAKGLGVDPSDPVQNLKGGVRYLKENIDKFGVEGGLAAYNAGPGRVQKTSDFNSLPAETRAYVPSVMNRAAQIASSNTGVVSDAGPMGISEYIGAFDRAKAANDDAAVKEIGSALQKQFDDALAKAKAAGDTEAVNEISGMRSKYVGGPVAAPKPTPAPAPEARPAEVKQDEPFDYKALGKKALRTVDNVVRGAADTLTFGFADEIAAKMDQLTGRAKNYDEALKAQRAQDAQGGTARLVGQVGGALLPTGAVVRGMESGSRLVRAGAGAATGALQGGLYGAGSAEDGKRLEGAQEGAAFGALTGGVLGGILPATVTQKGSAFIDKAGSKEAARLDAEIVKDLSSIAQNPNMRGGKVQAVQMNALEQKYVNEASAAMKELGKDGLKKLGVNGSEVNAALQARKIITPDELQALRTNPAGNALADAIEKAQRTRALTAANPADNNLLVKGIRVASDYALPGILSKPINYVLNNRKSREEVVGKLLKNSGAADNVLERLGPSQATKSMEELQKLAQQASTSRQAQQAAAQAAKAAGKVAKVENPNAAISELQSKDPTYLLGLSNKFGAPRNDAQMAEFSKVLKDQMEARAKKAMTNQEVQKLVSDLAKGPQVDPRIQVLQDSRRPLSGAFQELLPGGRSGLNLTSDQAIDALRLTSRQFKDRPLGQAAQDILRSGNVKDEAAFYGLQNQLRKLQEQGIISGQPGALSAQTSAIRNPASYAANVKNAEEALKLARDSAPSKEIAQFANSVGRIKSSAEKLKAVEERLAKTTDPAEVDYLTNFVKPLAKFGKK